MKLQAPAFRSAQLQPLLACEERTSGWNSSLCSPSQLCFANKNKMKWCQSKIRGKLAESGYKKHMHSLYLLLHKSEIRIYSYEQQR